MILSPLARLRERRLIARALMIAADELSSWPIEDGATADEIRTLLRRDYADLEGAFTPHRGVWDEALERQIDADAAIVDPPPPPEPKRVPMAVEATPRASHRAPTDDEADMLPF